MRHPGGHALSGSASGSGKQSTERRGMSTNAIDVGNGKEGPGSMMAMAKRVGMWGAIAGLVGGALMIGLMIVVMGTSGAGYASPLNLGIPAFVKTIAPPVSMLPKLMSLMGIHLPAAAMAKLGPVIANGHIPPAMTHQLGGMLLAMHVPAAKVHMIGALMGGHASNSEIANLLTTLSPAARNAVMSAMPVSAGHVVIGAVTHFAISAIVGMTIAMMIIGVGIGRLQMPWLRTPGGIIAASVAGGALVYVVNRWLILPAIDPMMKLVPETALFIGHLLFGLVVGIGIVMIARHEGVLDDSPVRRAALA